VRARVRALERDRVSDLRQKEIGSPDVYRLPETPSNGVATRVRSVWREGGTPGFPGESKVVPPQGFSRKRAGAKSEPFAPLCSRAGELAGQATPL